MKNIKTIIILFILSFKLFAQIDYPQVIIEKNGIAKVSKYLVLPKDNPNYYREPVGLMLQSETFFDSKGRMTSFFSPNGAVASHSDSKDLKEFYFYKNDKIVRMDRVDFDSISVEYLYFEKKNIILKKKTNAKNERIGLEIIYIDDNGKEIKKIEIDFHNTTELNNTVYFYLSNFNYHKNTKKVKLSRKLFNISMNQLKILKVSIEPEEIENELGQIGKTIEIDDVHFETSFVYNKQKQLIKEVSVNAKIEYVYDKKGLLISCTNKNKQYCFRSKFVYSSM